MESTDWQPWGSPVVPVGGLGRSSHPHLADLGLVLHLPRGMSALRQVCRLRAMTTEVSVGLSKIKYDLPLPKAFGRYISAPVTISRSYPHRHVNPEHERSPHLCCLESCPASNAPSRIPGLEHPASSPRPRIPQLSLPCYPPGHEKTLQPLAFAAVSCVE